MPLYEYECLECGASFEALVRKAGEVSEVKCPGCRSRNLEEKVSSFAAVSKAGASGASNCAPSGS
jgi:putative FmdB family regulatory protein